MNINKQLSSTQNNPALQTRRNKILVTVRGLNKLPSVDKPDVISSVFLAAFSLMRNNCTRASIALILSPWLSTSWLSRQGEVRSCTRVAMFCLLSSTMLYKSSKLWNNKTKNALNDKLFITTFLMKRYLIKALHFFLNGQINTYQQVQVKHFTLSNKLWQLK